MSFPEVPIEEPIPEFGDRPMVVCADCGADWMTEPCESGCSNDLDTSSKAEAVIEAAQYQGS